MFRHFFSFEPYLIHKYRNALVKIHCIHTNWTLRQVDILEIMEVVRNM